VAIEKIQWVMTSNPGESIPLSLSGSFPTLLARDAASKSVLESVLASKIPAQRADATTDVVDAAKHGEGLIRHLTVPTFDAISRGPPMQQSCVSRHTTNHPATFALTAENSERSEESHD
jgi:hypothetical protein